MLFFIRTRRKSNHHVPARCGWMSRETFMKNLKSPAIRKQGVKPMSCPQCKTGYLIIKKGKYGEFWGCNNYPKCKFTKNQT